MYDVTLDQIAATCLALGVDRHCLSSTELAVLPTQPVEPLDLSQIRRLIFDGEDPLGQAFCAARTAEERRPRGQTFTPAPIVRSMLEWTKGRVTPARVVDPGCGSGRYILAALRAFPHAVGLASDLDPYATLMTRANARVLGLESRLKVIVGDYRARLRAAGAACAMMSGSGPTVFGIFTDAGDAARAAEMMRQETDADVHLTHTMGQM